MRDARRGLATGLLAASALAACDATAEEAPDDPRAAWVKAHAVPLATEIAGSGFEDLAPIGAAIGDARIVALGECTHGSREVFRMKHRFFEWLATEKRFTVFAIEANLPEAYRLDEYVTTGKGDPEALIGGMYFWTWNTEEVLDLVEWMRAFNASGKGPVHFTGFDMQTPGVAMSVVEGFLAQTDPSLAQQAREAHLLLRRAQPAASGFAPATAVIAGAKAAGHEVTLSGWIRTEELDGWAGIWCRVDGAGSKVLAFDNMAASAPRGTTPWTKYRIVLKAPAETEGVAFGALSAGKGKAWFDDLAVELDGKAYDPGAAADFAFEGETPRGFFTPPSIKSYRVRTVPDGAHGGKRCLLIESMAAAPGGSPEDALRACASVRDVLTSRRVELTKSAGAAATDWAIRNACVVAQCAEMRAFPDDGGVRDRAMAENLAWILDSRPGARVVAWAHNGHVSREKGAMGSHLATKFGKDYLPVAFATGEGRYRAMSDGELRENDLAAPPEGSCEEVFVRTKLPRLYLDLTAADAAKPESAWLTKPILFRSIGALAMANQFQRQTLPDLYDGLIWIGETTASVPLR